MSNDKKMVSVAFSTIDPGQRKVGNVQLLEIDVQLFDSMSRQAFMDNTIKAAGEFWDQMKGGQLPGQMLAPKTVLPNTD